MTLLYILDEDNNPVQCTDAQKWFESQESGKRHVAFTQVGATQVSTVFLGVDAGLGGEWTDPLLFETMIFGDGRFAGFIRRYSTYADAKMGHQVAVDLVTAFRNEACNDDV